MEVLCLHLALVHNRLQEMGYDGQALSQALYDVMVDDFDVALREESLSDTGVSRRIKPMARMFFDRARQYKPAVLGANQGDNSLLRQLIEKRLLSDPGKVNAYIRYIRDIDKRLNSTDLGEIALTTFDFPEFDEQL